MSELLWLWTVSNYHNSMLKRKATAVHKDLEQQERYGHDRIAVFSSEEKAVSFMIERAEQNAKKAQLAAKRAEETLRKLKKKFNR